MSPSVADRNPARTRALQDLVIGLARSDFDAHHETWTLPDVVVLICAYEEEDCIEGVLEHIPAAACGLPVRTVVIVDGGEDRTAALAKKAGAATFVFPVNLGHGVALRTGYRLCVDGGARYVVTLDADGQNDPSEIDTMLAPLIADEADFVLASRRLGTDHTADAYRKLGVRVFAGLVNVLNRTSLTDTSNGFRALRATMLADVVTRLEQDQYQTADLLITCIRRQWRVVERPTIWHERTAGESKKGVNWRYGFRYASVVWQTWRRER